MTQKTKKTGEYRNLRLGKNIWYFDVKVKGGWQSLSGLSGETSQEDAEKFAQNTADAWRKK